MPEGPREMVHSWNNRAPLGDVYIPTKNNPLGDINPKIPNPKSQNIKIQKYKNTRVQSPKFQNPKIQNPQINRYIDIYI